MKISHSSSGLTATSFGWFRVAWTAGPPSPACPAAYAPLAIVVTTPRLLTMRMQWLPVSAM